MVHSKTRTVLKNFEYFRLTKIDTDFTHILAPSKICGIRQSKNLGTGPSLFYQLVQALSECINCSGTLTVSAPIPQSEQQMPVMDCISSC